MCLGSVLDFLEVLKAGVGEAQSQDTCLLSDHHLQRAALGALYLIFIYHPLSMFKEAYLSRRKHAEL